MSKYVVGFSVTVLGPIHIDIYIPSQLKFPDVNSIVYSSLFHRFLLIFCIENIIKSRNNLTVFSNLSFGPFFVPLHWTSVSSASWCHFILGVLYRLTTLITFVCTALASVSTIVWSKENTPYSK